MNREAGTVWGQSEAHRYEVAKHGPDGAVFLDPMLYDFLTPENIQGKNVLDIGSGTGPWTEFAAKQGARTVFGLDLNEAMVGKGRERIAKLHENFALLGKIRVMKGDAGDLPFKERPDGYFDRVLSINVGCNLPNGTFEQHFAEAYRMTKEGGTMLVTAPDSLTRVFTDGKDEGNIQGKINATWSWGRSGKSAKEIISEFPHILRATFIENEEGKPVLITKENAARVKSGDPIIRKIPGLAVDNIYHEGQEYFDAVRKAGWHVHSMTSMIFANQEERHAYNRTHPDATLGDEYIADSGGGPFLVLELVKKRTDY